MIANYLVVGDPLSEVQSETEKGLNFVKKAGFGLVIENCRANLGLIRTLRGLNSTFGCFDADDYNESDAEQRFASNPLLALSEFFYWTRKLQARFFAGDYASAVEASRRAHQLLWPAASQVETGDFRFYAALAHAAAWNSASSEERQKHFAALNDHHRQLEIWALHCPANFENKTCARQRVKSRALKAGCSTLNTSTKRRSVRHAKTVSHIARRSPTNVQRSFIRREDLLKLPTSICEMPGSAIYAGARTRRFDSSMNGIHRSRQRRLHPTLAPFSPS